ncbi:hypothetical protein EDB83DRAFT_2347423 [Lactarius deliciosus]|nr:hypothetical protein EDB83DRAFT_2347423 [Lactarius deliciosus]
MSILGFFFLISCTISCDTPITAFYTCRQNTPGSVADADGSLRRADAKLALTRGRGCGSATIQSLLLHRLHLYRQASNMSSLCPSLSNTIQKGGSHAWLRDTVKA